MNKKFLSAILFGALMVSSTGTFVSCKDYDDDIKDLQEQINSNKDAIAALQKLVGEGKWVTNISSIENGFSVTMSDGTTTSITGIKGADGKNGTEWTIGEDGFWYKDGEKTASQAVAKDGEDGKAGATAPSPKISADGFWVVYEWDAAKGEFVEKTTEISAQGTGAYVVKKDGVYVLHIADETGAFQDVTLPATSDSFVAEAPYSDVRVIFETARWSKWSATNALAKELLKEFPALADIKTNDVVKQGGNLPLIVTPANVELTDKFAFALQGADGKTADIAVSTPVKGLPVNTSIQTEYMPVGFDLDGNGKIEGDEIQCLHVEKYMQTRAAENDCFWALKVEPAYDTAKKKYAQVANASLSIANEKGTTVKTAFAYSVMADDKTNADVTIKVNKSAKYAETIDVFEKPSTTEDAIFTLKNQYDGHFILSLTNEVQKEKYGLSVEGSKLHIANMPANETSIKVNMKLIALGLNGSVAGSGEKAENYVVEITINQGVETTGILADKAVTLAAKATDAKLRWNIKDLGLTAVQLDNFLKGDVKMTATREAMEEGQNGVLEEKKYVAYNAAVNFYDAKGDKITATYGGNPANYVTFGFDVDATATPTELKGYTAEKFLPKDYVLTLTSSAKGTTTIIYSASATLAVSNPDVTATYIKLVPAFVENNVFQITGKVDVKNGKVTYKLADGLILNNGTALKGFIDMDYKNYIDNGGDTEDKAAYGNYNWLGDDKKADPNAELSVNVWKTKAQIGNTWTAAEWNQLYTERNIRAVYTWFGNDKNIDKFDYKVKVKSEIFSETPAEAIIMDATKLSAVFGGQNGTNTIDIQKAITKALVAAGTDKDKEYNLFATTGKKNKYNDYIAGPKVNDGYVVTSAGKPIAIKADDLMDMGMTMDQYIAYTSTTNKPTYYLKLKSAIYYNGKEYATIDEAKNAVLAALDETATDEAKNAAAKEVEDNAITLKGWNDLYTAYDTYYKLDTEKGQYKLSGVASADKIPADDATLISLFNSYNSLTVLTQKEGTEVQNATPADSRIANVNIAFADALEATKYFQNVATNGVVSGTTITAIDSAPADVTGGKVTVPMQISVTDIWGKTMVRTFDVTVTTK